MGGTVGPYQTDDLLQKFWRNSHPCVAEGVIPSPDTGHPLSSYRVLARLDPVLAEAKAAAAKNSVNDGAPDAEAERMTPSNEERAATAEKLLIFCDIIKGQPGEIAAAPYSVISDLMTDLMHYAEREEIDFSDALATAYSAPSLSALVLPKTISLSVRFVCRLFIICSEFGVQEAA